MGLRSLVYDQFYHFYYKRKRMLKQSDVLPRFCILNMEAALLLDLPSKCKGKNLVHFIQCHCPLIINAKLPAAGNFSLKQMVSMYIQISEFYPQSLREKTIFNILPSNNNSGHHWQKSTVGTLKVIHRNIESNRMQ